MVSTQGYEINARIGENGEPSPSLNKNSNEMAKGRFESGDFDENGEFDKTGKNGELSPKFDGCSYDVAKGPF